MLANPTAGTADPARYNRTFFATQQQESLPSARAVVPLVMNLVRPESVVDFGCGVGAWLRVFADSGVADYLGLDGEYVARADLLIEPERFRAADLTGQVNLGRTFDLAVCLEVGEHLPPRSAAGLVGLLTAAAPCVLFSAAVPGQGGTHHVNERWPGYWQKLFAARQFVRLDPIRPRIWREPSVEWWFKQNIFLYVRQDAVAASRELQLEAAAAEANPFELVHTDLLAPLTTLRGLARAFPAAVRRAMARTAGRGRP